jgi:hypothetical protein
MKFTFDNRGADSPLVETMWRTTSDAEGSFTSTAIATWELVFTRSNGVMRATLRGPETFSSPALVPADAEFIGIQFKLGTYMPTLPTHQFVDRAIELPARGGRRTFGFLGKVWDVPRFDNADVFVGRLERAGLLRSDPVVRASLAGHPPTVSLRTVQRRILHVTGVTRRTLQLIERARRAATQLEEGASIADVVHGSGYSDQPHLTRSLRRFLGQTPGQILREGAVG